MSSIKPTGNPQPPPRPPRNYEGLKKTLLVLLKVVGVVILAMIIAAGIFLGTCAYIGRGFRA